MLRRIDINDFNATVDFGGVRSLSDTSLALCLMSLSLITKRYLWCDNLDELDDTQWDTLDSQISLALDEIMSGLTGVIVPSANNTLDTNNFLVCDGSQYSKQDYPALYSSLDSQYIIDSDNFVVPDLRDRFIVGTGNNYAIGDNGGSDTHTLSIDELPPHKHGYTQYTFGVDIESVGVPDPTGVGQPQLPQETGITGSGAPHENRPPYYALMFYIIAK